jgi:hypothetical protein
VRRAAAGREQRAEVRHRALHQILQQPLRSSPKFVLLVLALLARRGAVAADH